MDLDGYLFLDNTPRQWLIAVGVGVATIAVVRLLLWLIRTRVAAFAKHTATTWDDLLVAALQRTRWYFLLGLGLYTTSLSLVLPEEADVILLAAVIVLSLVQSGVWATTALRYWAGEHQRRAMEEDRAAATTMAALVFMGQVVIWVAVFLLVLQNVGVNVTALITGLGVGGIAVALALNKVLSDLFASLAIVLDKPFVLGDFVIVGELMGSVEHVGLKTTRIRSLWGEQLVFSNADLLDSRIRNFGRMKERRVSFKLGVTYQTAREKLEVIPGIIRRAIEAQEGTRFDRSHFSSYGDFSLVFETIYYVLSPDYNTYMDVQQAIYLQIHREFEAQGIEFAYPTQTLFLNRVGGESPGKPEAA